MLPTGRPHGDSGETLNLAHAILLGKVDLFSQLDLSTLAQLAGYVEPMAVRDGTVLCRQGEPGDSLYVVARGSFGVFVAGAEGQGEIRMATMHAAEYFGEMALLTDEPRSATVRAQGDGEVLRLDRSRFLSLFKRQPTVATAVTAKLCRRLQATNQEVVLSHRVTDSLLDRVLGELPTRRRRQLLEASLLEQPFPPALRALFGEESEGVAGDLARLGADEGQPSQPVLRALRERFEREWGPEQVQQASLHMASRLAEAQCWEEALSVAARHGERRLFAGILGRALRSHPALPAERALHWVQFVTDEEAAQDVELALVRAFLHEEQEDPVAAAQVLRRALGAAQASGAAAANERLTRALKEAVGPRPEPLTPREREVALLVAQGLTNAEIADRLIISVRTAESHVNNILNKLGFWSRTQVAAWAAKQGLGTPPRGAA